MGDHLNSAAKVFAPALLGDHLMIDLSCGEIVVLAKFGIGEPFIMPQVKIGFRTVICDKHFTVLVITSYSIHYTKLYDVNPLPVPVASNNGPVCSGADLELFTQNFNSYSWSGPGGFTSILQNPVVSDIQTYQSGLYSVVVSNQYNCSATGQTLVELLPSPELTVSGTNIYCEGETIQLNSNPAGLSDYQWTGAGDFTAYTQNISRPNATPAMSGTYTVSANSGEGCPASGSYNITVYPMVNAVV